MRRTRIAVLGLSFEPGTDDIREDTSIKVIRLFLKAGSRIVAYDLVAMKSAKSILLEISYSGSALNCLEGADCCTLATDWEEFSRIKAGGPSVENENTSSH